MSGLSIPFQYNKNPSESHISKRHEQVELESRRSQTPPVPRSKPKLFSFETVKGFLSSKSRSSVAHSSVDTTENAGSDIDELGTIKAARFTHFPPPLPIVIDPPEHEVASDTSVQRNQHNLPDVTTVNAERKVATGYIHKMNTLSGPTSTITKADNLKDSISSFLKSLERFNAFVDEIVGIHPYSKAAWFILSFASKKLIDQKNREEAVCSLLSKMNEVYLALTTSELQDIESMKGVVERICQQTLECSYFIREYAQNEKFRTRFLKNLISGTDESVQKYNNVFDELRQQFLARATGDTFVVVRRIWKGVEDLGEDLEDLARDVDLNSMPYVSGAGLNTQKTCLEGTRRETLEEITSWINCTEDNTPRVFWLYGNAGTGKSVIAHTIADRFKKIGRLGSCFCFDRNEMAQQRDKKVFSTIARDLADRDEHVRKALMDAIRRDTSLKNTMDVLQQWKEMVLKPVQKLSEEIVGPMVIIIDALDESGTAESRNHLLRILSGKVNDDESHIAKLPSHIRILLTSRPLPDIHKALNLVEHVQQKSMDRIPPEWSRRDIFQFISRELSDVEEMNDQDASMLTGASDGLFEWARLACAFIKSVNDAGTSARERFETVITSNKDERIYQLTLKTIFPEDRTRSIRLTRFRSVMAQIIGTAEPIPRASLGSMRRHFGSTDHQKIDVDVIIKPLGALLSGTTDSSPIRSLHASFPEFLTDQNRSGEFFTNLSGVHDELAFACLGVMRAELRFNICDLPNSYLPNSEIRDLPHRIQANITRQLSYSCRFWTEHLRHTSFSLPLAKEIRDFFNSEKLLFWFEVLSLEKKISICTSLLSFVVEWSVSQSESKDICDDAADAQKFIRTFGRAISYSTPHLYISAVPFSPRGSCISRKFSARFGKVLKISQGCNEAWSVIQGVLRGHDAFVCCLALSPDGKRIVSGSGDETIRLWDAETGEQLRPILEGHQDYISSVAFSPDGKHVVSGSADKTIWVWDVETGKRLGPPLEGHQAEVSFVAFSPDGKHILSGSLDKTIRLWDAQTGKEVRPLLAGHQDGVCCVAFSPNGTRIVSGSLDETIRLWDVQTGKEVLPLLAGHQDGVYCVAFSPNGKRIVSGSADKTIRLWDAETGKQLGPPIEGHQDEVSFVSFSSDGKRIVSGSADMTVRLWCAETGEQLGPPFEGHHGRVVSVLFSPDGTRIVSGSHDKTIRLWDAGAGERPGPRIRGHQDEVSSVASSPDGKRIVSGSIDMTIRLWDAETGEQMLPPLEEHQGLVLSVAFSPDGKHVVSGSADNTIRLWNAETGGQLQPPLEGHHGQVVCVVFSPDGKRIVSGSADKTIRLWNAETGEQLGPPFEGHQDNIDSVAFSSDGKRVVSGSTDRTIRLWDGETGKQLQPPIEGHQHDVDSVAFSPDGKCIVSGSADRTIRLWDAETGKQLGPPLEGHQDEVFSVAFSPDGKRIVSGSADKTIRLWDIQTGKQLGPPLEGHQDKVISVVFSPDGKCIVSGSFDKTIRVWCVGEGDQLRPPGGPPDSVLQHSICFSSQLEHGLFEPIELFDQISSSSRTESRISMDGTSSGWVRIGPMSSLLFWSPPMYDLRCFSPSTRIIIPAPNAQLDLSNMAHGSSWHLCYDDR